MEQRARRGLREFTEATAGKGPPATDRVRAISPLLAEGVERFIFSDMFAEPGLAPRERELITVAVLAALGDTDRQLAVHVSAALSSGADPEELVRLCEQIAPYAGFPRALNALRSVDAAIAEAGRRPPPPDTDIRLDDHHTRFVDSPGTGVPLLLIHPPELDHHAWRDTIQALDGRRRAIAPDLRGAGAAADAAPAESLEQIARDLGLLLEALGVDQVEVVSAAGSGLAAQLVLALPESFSAVTILATSQTAEPSDRGAGALTSWFTPRDLAEDAWPVRYARDRLRRRSPEGYAALARLIEIIEPDPGSFEGRPLRVIRRGAMPPLTDPAGLAEDLTT